LGVVAVDGVGLLAEEKDEGTVYTSLMEDFRKHSLVEATESGFL
jgi:hypothetical protein